MSGYTAAAIVTSAIISSESASRSAAKQRKAAENAEAIRVKEADEARTEAERIAKETTPEAANAANAIQFGTEDDNDIGGVSEFIRPNTKTSLGTSSGSGLGFAL